MQLPTTQFLLLHLTATLTINTVAEQAVYVQHLSPYLLTCNVSGSSDAAIEWYRSNSSAPIVSGPRAVISTESGVDSVLGTLFLTSVDSNDEGGYVCVATDPQTGYSVQKTIVYLLIAGNICLYYHTLNSCNKIVLYLYSLLLILLVYA